MPQVRFLQHPVRHQAQDHEQPEVEGTGRNRFRRCRQGRCRRSQGSRTEQGCRKGHGGRRRAYAEGFRAGTRRARRNAQYGRGSGLNGQVGIRHKAVNHYVSEYVREQAHTNGIYHKMSPMHLDRYVQKIAGRHNVWDADTIDQMECLVSGIAGKRIT